MNMMNIVLQIGFEPMSPTSHYEYPRYKLGSVLQDINFLWINGIRTQNCLEHRCYGCVILTIQFVVMIGIEPTLYIVPSVSD